MANNGQFNEWENLGRNIQDVIDSAIRSQDYRQLSRNIGDVINTGSDAVRRVVENAAQKRVSTVRYTQPGYSQVQEKKPIPVLYGSTGRLTTKGILKTVFGGILAATGFVIALTGGIFSMLGYGLASVATGGLGLGSLVGGSVMLAGGVRNLGRAGRFKIYLKTLGEKTHISLEKLSRSVGKSEQFVRKELNGMIRQGLFLEGHLDGTQQTLITSEETYKLYQQSARKQAQAAQNQAQKAKPERDPEVQEVLDKGNAFVEEIRRCNDEIPGEEISAKMDRMEHIVQKIFERAESHPEIIPDLKKMMDYYLPTTVKLLNAYADMDRQPIQGETIQASKREIDATLDTLNLAFEKLLDSVFQDTAMDVSSDISVLNTLLAQEGLSGSDFR